MQDTMATTTTREPFTREAMGAEVPVFGDDEEENAWRSG